MIPLLSKYYRINHCAYWCLSYLFNPQQRSPRWRSSLTSSSCWSKARSGKLNWRSGRMHGQCIRPSVLSYGRLCVGSTMRGATYWTAIIGTWSTRWVERNGGRKEVHWNWHLITLQVFGTTELPDKPIMLPPFVDSRHCLPYHLTRKGGAVADRIVSVLGYGCPHITYSPTLYPITSILLHFMSGEYLPSWALELPNSRWWFFALIFTPMLTIDVGHSFNKFKYGNTLLERTILGYFKVRESSRLY